MDLFVKIRSTFGDPIYVWRPNFTIRKYANCLTKINWYEPFKNNCIIYY